MCMIKLKELIKCLGISIGVGVVSAVLNAKSMSSYKNINLPPLSPASIVFPIVWSILFILMGISSYLICVSRNSDRKKALWIYAVQLVLNFIWSPIFFGLNMYLLAFFDLVLLWIAVLWMIIEFYKINKVSAWLQIPYILWLTFAGYLNFAIFLLN